MSRLDDFVYVSRPDLLDLVEEGVLFGDAKAALASDAEGATEITILGGYFNPGELVGLCLNVPRSRREACRVRIVVGLDRYNGMAEIWGTLRRMRAELRRKGFRDLSVGVIPPLPIHFHTKLFGFIKSTQPVWYVGSENPGSARHELMVRVVGRHDGLVGYAKAAINRAVSVDFDPPKRAAISTLRELFLSGRLAHKPPKQRLFAFDAFRFSPSERATLDELASQGLDVPHARPRTEGYGFSLLSALGVEPFSVSRPSGGDGQRVRYRESAIETVLGFWMPEIYAWELDAKFKEETSAREKYLENISGMLISPQWAAQVWDEYATHVAGMQKFLERHQVDVFPIPDHEQAFRKFLTSRTKVLADANARSRHASVMTLTPMPDIWTDLVAVERFEESFFADLAYRAGPHAVRKGRVIRSLTGAVDGYPVTDDDFREALEHRLGAANWIDDDWVE